MLIYSRKSGGARCDTVERVEGQGAIQWKEWRGKARYSGKSGGARRDTVERVEGQGAIQWKEWRGKARSLRNSTGDGMSLGDGLLYLHLKLSVV